MEKKKKSKSEQIAVGLSSFPRTRLDRSDSSTVWTPPKRKKKNKQRTLQPSVWPINISAALNDCLQYSLFCLFFVYLGFFNTFFSFKSMSTWIWPIVTPETVLALDLWRASTTRISCSGFRADLWGRLLWGYHQISLNTASCFRCSLRWAECCQRRCVQSSRNHPIVPESLISVSWQQVITLSSNIIYDNVCNAKQAEAGRTDEPLNTTYRRPHWSLSTFTNPLGYNSFPKTKERTKRNFNESAVGQPLMTAAWRSLSLKTAGWHGRSDAHVCCWRGKVLLYVSFTFTTAADNGSDRKTLITKDQKPNSGNASARDPIFTGRSGRRKTHRANVQNIKTPLSDSCLSWLNEILLDVGSSRGKPEGPACAHHPIASPKATTR